MSSNDMAPPGRLCFVTVGATAAFNSLIAATLDHSFVKALRKAGYTNLLIQYGKEGKGLFEKLTAELPSSIKSDMTINGFDFNKEGLDQEMRAARGKEGSPEGVVISHAGSGTLMAALRMDVPLIVVPNPQLLHNHQEDLAKALEDQGYVIHGHIYDLPDALSRVEELSKTHKTWPPVNSGPHIQAPGVKGMLDDETGLYD